MGNLTANTNYNVYGSERIYGNAQGTSISKKGSTDLDINDFIQLFTTELTNQDILNTDGSSSGGSNTDYIGQLAQFTNLQTMQTLTEIVYAQYGASVVGKNVIVANYNSMGEYKQDEGVVESVMLVDGDVTVTVNGVTYPMSAIMEITTGASKSEAE